MVEEIVQQWRKDGRDRVIQYINAPLQPEPSILSRPQIAYEPSNLVCQISKSGLAFASSKHVKKAIMSHRPHRPSNPGR